jgi:hypothetical protein
MLDQLNEIHHTVRFFIKQNGSLNGLTLEDFDEEYKALRSEAAKEDYLQELYDALTEEA